jgi:hypothetical protein
MGKPKGILKIRVLMVLEVVFMDSDFGKRRRFSSRKIPFR